MTNKDMLRDWSSKATCNVLLQFHGLGKNIYGLANQFIPFYLNSKHVFLDFSYPEF